MTEPIVFACDPYLWSFLQGNIATLGLVLTILKGLAIAIPAVEGNKIFKLFSVTLTAVTSLRKPKNTKT